MAETPPSNYDELNSMVEDGTDTASSKDAVKAKGVKVRAIKAAQDARKAGDWDRRWSDFIKIYSNKYPYEELSEYEDIVVPNMVFSTVNVIVPSIAINSPKIMVTANQMEDAGPAEVVEAVVNHQWRAYNVQDQVRAAVKDQVIIGHGWNKVVWVNEEKEVPLSREEFAESVAQALQIKDATLQADPGAVEAFPDDEALIKSLPSKRVKIVKDQPLVKRISPFDMFVDPDAKTLEDARWVAQRSYVPIEVARTNPLWNATVRSRLVKKQKSSARDEVEVEDSGQDSGEDGFAEIWEFYDLIDMQMCTFGEGTEGYLLDPEDSVFPDGHPFVLITNYEVPERFFPIGDVENIFPLQLEIAITRTAQINDRKRGRRITLFREAALGNQGVEDLRAGKDNVMIPVIKDLPFADVFAQVSSMGLQPEWYRAGEIAMEDINLVSGIAEYVRGGAADIRRTATEVGVMQDAANARSSDKLFKVEQAMGRIAERMIKLSQQFMDTEAVARVVTDNTVVDWVPYSRDALQGDFTFQVEAGSSQPQNESFRRQQAMQMMDVFGGHIGTGLLNDQEFVSEVMRLLGFNNAERLLGPGIPPPVPEGMDPAMMGDPAMMAGPPPM